MEERIRPTRSGLFAIELLIAVGVFSLCAAICVGLFVRAELMSRHSDDLNRAVTAARGAAECYKAAGGDLARTAELTGGTLTEDGRLALVFDGSWQPLGTCGTGVEALFLLELTPREAAGCAAARLRVTEALDAGSLAQADILAQAADAGSLLDWDVAALEVRP